MRESIPINVPQIGEEEIEAVVKVLRSGVLTTSLGEGPMAKRFEEAFAKFVEAKHAVAVNSGTAALHASVVAAGIGPGDEVILPSFTFVATAEVVVLSGAKPVFVDIDPDTYNVDPEKIERAITKKTKAVLPVDLYGLPADMDAVKEIAEKHSLVIIEDAAQAHGATYKKKPPGNFADIACWSFYASKNMTTGEGGMITTNNDEIVEKLCLFRTHGEKKKYISSFLGHNFRMPEIEAAIGFIQLQKLTGFLEKRRRNAAMLTQKLRGAEKRLQLPIEPESCKHSWYLYTVRLKGAEAKARDNAVEALRKSGISATVYYPVPIHQMPYYQRFGSQRLPETEETSKQVFSLPVHPSVTSKQIEYIGDSLLRIA